AEAVGLALDEGGTLAAARPLHGLPRGLPHRQDVVAVHHDPGHAVGGGAVPDVLHGDDLGDRGGGAVEVVLADEEDRHPPDGRHVHRFVDRALVGAAIAEEARHHLVGAAHAGGEAHADGHRLAAADDGDGGDHAHRHVADVHRAPLALAAAGGL